MGMNALEEIEILEEDAAVERYVEGEPFDHTVEHIQMLLSQKV